MGGIVSLAEPGSVQPEQSMLSRPRATRPRRPDDVAPVYKKATIKGSERPPRESHRRNDAAPVTTYIPSGVSSRRKPVEPIVAGRKVEHLTLKERPPHITSQMKTKLAIARAEQAVLATKEAARAMPIPKKSSRRRLSPPSDGSVTSTTSPVNSENWPLPKASPKDSVMRLSSDTQKSQQQHKQMTITEPNQEEDDASVMIPATNKAWDAIIEELNSDSDADSFTTASDPEGAEHGDIQIGLVTNEQPSQNDNEALRPPPLRTTRYKTVAESTIDPLPGPPMAVKKLGAPDTASRCASLVTLNHSHSAGRLFQATGDDRKVRFGEPKVFIHITGEPARIPKVPSKDEYKALVARGMREFQEYADKQNQHLPALPKKSSPAKSPPPKKSQATEKSEPPPKAPMPSKPESKATPHRRLKSEPLLKWSAPPPKVPIPPKPESKVAPHRQLNLEPLLESSASPPKSAEQKDISLKQSVKGAFGALRKRTSKALSFDGTPGPKRRSLAVLMQPQSVRQSVEDISAQVATGRGRPRRRDSRREGRAKLQKSQRMSSGASNSPRTSRFFKRSSGSARNSALRLSIHNRMPSLPQVAELEGEGPYYELAAFDADGNVPRDRSLSPIRVWNNGGATWLAANRMMNETSSTLALAPAVAVNTVIRRRDWAAEYRTAIAV
ncbi:hypothetical protein CLAFUW4_09693 [Fulvia fulva]|uniref:Uncharacterized protein n=1 Tax=Passalora fulva TaxID=5499 RepID=A0A9Q8UTR0_PASFU|nr:uncharacterized protein CLAFUR5_09786 [Fulvia fulva]KAK4613504.1 hypothetical protein CLAFUR4_09698 [Fulvia fulva]KAK4614754.1 hypothetical protein CLAFUR0_09689 [Fulvia fulva]UJO22136.1 hypothetical protein CLAFUR5_09786 [Fulvia fulva]WPV19919.1 hypothetical protein CLAFUW4_09693 [Fulvia fulva]WPV35393.1 hypothetical protein CLAFUW7_09694 [Fulvia fulva]